MVFNFRLHNLVDVEPFEHNGDLVLHWFGLTDGCYWMELGGSELFRYSQSFLETSGNPSPCDPYTHYYVVRLWEDVLNILPDILAPVPEALHRLLAADTWVRWKEQAVTWAESRNSDASEYAYALATRWWGDRHLDTGYLQHGPCLWFWNDGVDIHAAWDNRGLEQNGTPVWMAEVGEVAVRVERFLEEVAYFDWRLMEAMRQRINEVLAYWPRPAIFIDKAKLAAEQEERSKWLERSVEKAVRARPTDWDPIIKAVETIEAATQS